MLPMQNGRSLLTYPADCTSFKSPQKHQYDDDTGEVKGLPNNKARKNYEIPLIGDTTCAI